MRGRVFSIICIIFIFLLSGCSIVSDKIVFLRNSSNVYEEFNIAGILTERQQYEQAIEKYLFVTEQSSQLKSKAYNNLGICYYSLNDYDNALKYYTLAIEACSDSPTEKKSTEIDATYFNRGSFFIQIGENDKGISDYMLAISLNFNNPIYHTALATEYLKKENYVNAIKYFNYAIELDKENHLAYKNLGTVYYLQKDYNNAVKFYNQAYNINNSDAELLNYLGETHSKLKDFEQAIFYYEEYIKLSFTFSKHYLVYLNLGYCYSQVKDYLSAISNYRKSLNYNPRFHETYYHLGVVYQDMKADDECILNFKKAAQMGNVLAQSYLKERNINW